MNHPLRTLLRELFVDPILRLLRIRRPKVWRVWATGTRNHVARMPIVPANSDHLLHTACLHQGAIRKET